jgi:hypothetical protein
MDKITGRFFIYNNRNKVIVFSKEPVKTSDRDDKSSPLIEMDVLDENPCRKDPTLYIIELEKYSLLLIIGGYRESKDK